MSKIEQIEVDSSEITKIYIEYESQIVERFKQKYNIVDLKDKGILQHRTKSAKIRLSGIPFNSKNIYGKKLYKQLTKFQLSDLSMNIKKDFN